MLAGLMLALAAALQWMPVQSILFGYYRDNLYLPQTIQGGLVIGVVLLVMLLTNLVVRNRSFLILTAGILSLLYLRLNRVLEPALVALVYLEIVIAFGRWVLRFFRTGESDSWRDYLEGFLVGLVGWGLLAIIGSLLGYGRFTHLRILTLFLGIVSCTRGFQMPFFARIIHRAKQLDRKEMAANLFILVVLLVQFAKAGRAFESDSLWYGLRPEYVLVVAHSFFDRLPLVQFVYYYPKLYELFLMPVSNLGDYSFILTFNVMILALLFLVVFMIGRSFELSRKESLLMTALIACIPAVANMGASAKPDIFTTLLILGCVYYLWQGFKEGDGDALAFAAIAGVLSFGGKLTSFAYTPLVLLGFGATILLFHGRDPRFPKPLWNRRLWVPVLAAALTTFGVFYRTWVTTGYPIYISLLKGLWQKLGFSLRYPLSLQKTNELAHSLQLSDMGARWCKLLLDPRDFGHVVNLWTGNIGVFLLLSVLVLVLLKKVDLKGNCRLIAALTPVMLSGLFFASIFKQGGDGNYYLVPLILSVALFYRLAIRQNAPGKKLLTAALLVFIPFQSAIMFVSHPSGHCGTNPFSLNLWQTPFNSKADSQSVFEMNGLGAIARYIEPGPTMAVGLGPKYILHRLPCIYEDLLSNAHPHLGNPKLNSEKELWSYLRRAKVGYYLVSHEFLTGQYKDQNVFEVYRDVYFKLKKDPRTFAVQDEDYTLLDISRITHSVAVRKGQR